MPLDLDDPEAVDYSGKTPLLPFDAYGDHDFVLLSFTESGPPGTEDNPSDKEYDLATVQVLKSTSPKVTQGETIGLFFQTGGDGVTIKNRKYKAANERAFMAACFDANTKDPEFKGKVARAQLLAADLSDGSVKIRQYRRKGNEKGEAAEGEEQEYYADDRYVAIK